MCSMSAGFVVSGAPPARTTRGNTKAKRTRKVNFMRAGIRVGNFLLGVLRGVPIEFKIVFAIEQDESFDSTARGVGPGEPAASVGGADDGTILQRQRHDVSGKGAAFEQDGNLGETAMVLIQDARFQGAAGLHGDGEG